MALNVYCKIPFKDVRETHPIIKKYAPIIGRSAVALKMKVGNFGRFDTNLKARNITGLGHGSTAEKPVWDEFWNDPEKLAYESERLFAKRSGMTVEEYTRIDTSDLPQGKERSAVVKLRVNQRFFHDTVLCSYLNQCCITGVTNTQLLEACHISGWADDINNRTNPKNGLCMNALFHRAYDNYLIGVTPDYEIVVSERMLAGTKNEEFQHYLQSIQGKLIILPEKFSPDRNLLETHYKLYKENQ